MASAAPALQEALASGEIQPEEAFASPEERAAPEGKWYVHAKQGVPYQAGENSDPDNVWRLVFTEDQLAEAYPDRKRDGYPILVRPEMLHAPDWLQQFERARLDQYEHPDFRIDYLRLHGGLTPTEETFQPGAPANALLDAFQGPILKGRPGLPSLEESFAPPPAPAKRAMLAKHERSETVQLPDGSWVNIYGRGTAKEGEPLEPKYDFEKLRYQTVEEAAAAAKRRSDETSPSTATEGMSPRDRERRQRGPARF